MSGLNERLECVVIASKKKASNFLNMKVIAEGRGVLLMGYGVHNQH